MAILSQFKCQKQNGWGNTKSQFTLLLQEPTVTDLRPREVGWQADCHAHFTGNWGLSLIPKKCSRVQAPVAVLTGSPEREEEIFVWLCESPVWLFILFKKYSSYVHWIKNIHLLWATHMYSASAFTDLRPGVLHNMLSHNAPKVSHSKLQREKSHIQLNKCIQHQQWFSGTAKHNFRVLVHGASQTLPRLINQQNFIMITDS